MPVPFDDLNAESTHSGAIAWLRFLDEENGESVRAALFQTSDQGEPLDFLLHPYGLARVPRAMGEPPGQVPCRLSPNRYFRPPLHLRY